MGGLITVIVIFLVITLAFLLGGFLAWRRVLHFAKGIERGLKMVPVLIHLPPPSDDVEVGNRDEREVAQEQISQAEVLYNLIAGTFKKGWKSKFYGQRHMGFEVIATDGLIKFFASIPVALLPVIRQSVLTAYPTANLEEVEDHNIFNPTGKLSATIGGEIELKQPYSYPIATFTNLKRDSIQALINGMMSLEEGDGAAVQILLRPAFAGWTKASESLADDKRDKKSKGGFPISMKDLAKAPFKAPEQKSEGGGDKPLSNLEQSVVDAIEEKTKHPGFEVMIRLVASSNTAARSQIILHNLSAAFALFDAPGLNGFNFKPAKDMESFVTAFIFRFFPPEAMKTVLNSVEMATLFHLPDAQFTHSTQVQRQYSKQVEAPSRLPSQGLLVGFNQFRGVTKEVRLTDEDRRRHIYVVGQTGTGKSTLLKQLVVQDMMAGRGLAFIDPHGDAAEELLALVPKSRTEDVIYFSPGETDYPLGLNLFEYRREDEKDFLIQEAINMLYKLYDPQHQGIIGPIYEHWFRNAALVVMADPAGGTFIDIPRLFIDRQFLREKLTHVKDPTVLDFWNKEMPTGQASGKQGEIIQWFVSKFGAFASNEIMRNTVGQVKSAFDLRQVMDEGKILIVNISKGRLGELNSMLLGMIFVMKSQAGAMSRANIPEAQRRDFTLYVDEFQNFSTDSFATILSEARKYRLSLIVANQYIAQLDEKVRDAVFGNAGTNVSFRSSPEDADFLTKQFAPALEARDLVNMPNLQAAVRLMVDGVPSQPFTLRLGPFLDATNLKLVNALKQLSSAKYAKPRSVVEAEIFKRFATKPAPDPFASLGLERPAAMSRPSSGHSELPPKSSFLDEWLAKRRSDNAIRPAPAATASRQPTPPPARPPLATPLAPKARAKQPAPEPKLPPAPPPQPRSATDLPSASLPRPGQSIMPHPESPNSAAETVQTPLPAPSSPAPKISHSFEAANKETAEAPTERPSEPAPALSDANDLNKKLEDLEIETQSKSQEVAAPPPATAIPTLKPGEIFIDEVGKIHKAGESGPKA